MVKSKKIISVVAAAAIAITSIASVVGGTLASTQVTWNATDPQGSSVIHYTLSDGTKVVNTAAVNWLSSDESVIAISGSTKSNVTFQLKKAGSAKIYALNARGGASTNPRMVVDTDNVARYTIANSKAEMKNQGDTSQIAMNLYGAKLSSSNIYTADTSKTLSMTNEIKWASRDTSVATVSNTGLITATTKEGSTFVDGTFTDCYGQPQVINYMVIIGSSAKVVIADPSGKYWIYTGTPNIYVECGEDGVVKTPSNFIFDTDNDPKTTGDRQTLTPITDAMKNTTPSAEWFDNTLPGYLTPAEKTAYESAVQTATTAGIVKGTDGNYYKKAPGTTNVWQAVQFNPTTGAVSNIVPESYVGGTTATANPSVKLYKIVPATDINPHEPAQQASAFDNTYEGFLTGFDYTTPSGEYKTWLDALSANTAQSITLNQSNVGVPLFDSITLNATTNPANLNTNTIWTISNSNINISSTTGKSVTVTAEKEGTSIVTAICGNKKYQCKITVKMTNILEPSQTGDSSRWIRIATNGDYSLIIRAKTIGWVNTLTSTYVDSKQQKGLNAWYNGDKTVVALGNQEYLPSNANLRNYAVKNDSLTKLGTPVEFSTENTIDGYSNPTSTIAKTGNDVAFLLSYGEAAKYCSRVYNINKPSEETAKINVYKLQYYTNDNTMLRTPTTEGYGLAVLKVSGAADTISTGGANQVNPALWVKSSGFDWNMIVTPAS